MFPSLQSSKNFVYINGILLSVGFFEYYLCIILHEYKTIVYFLGVLSIFCIRNYGLIYLINYGTSFFFEIVFDFFHYSGHRILHHPIIYRYFHKVHHRWLHPISITTFYQDPIDLVITNAIPTILAFYMIPRITNLQFHWILMYKNFVEISGHCGRISYPTSCFPQCIWIPKILGIELYAEDHDIHHSLNNCNYSKRFSLWDKVFSTYRGFHNEKVK
jgi:sterol desaturase/sphingolipid hydroxylase (fatty acid hydroxylase superfamily)